MAAGSAALLAALLLTDPDSGLLSGMPFGASVVAWLMMVARVFLIVAVAHFSWRALHDYDAADGESLYRQAQNGNTAASIALLSRAIIVAALLFVVADLARAQVPTRAHEHLPTLRAEIDAHWADIPVRAYPAGLIEHESCITLTHSRCWSPTSRLKTAREEGAGLGQLTRAYRANGSLRFDALAEMVQRHPALVGLAWDNIYQRPDLQLRAVVLKLRDDYQRLSSVRDPMQRLAMTDAAYNGGISGVINERRACGLADACDPQQWWGHVERTCLKSRVALYGNRSACDINRHHVVDVLRRRMPKYEGLV
jgi:hypothetical protein